MHVKRPKTLNQLGDTIVEVMIVLAVLGMAISVSYATANRSLLNTRQALENSQATEIAQSQVEAIRSMACSTGNLNCSSNPALFTTGTAHCVDTSVNPYGFPLSSDSACQQGTIPYSISIVYNNAPTDTFTVTVTWPDVLGQGNDTVTMIYRLHQ
jgi:type II secretory pathway pseudopilin PulG